MKLPITFALILSLVSGCYYTFGTMPTRQPVADRACTTSRALPITDAGIAAYGAAAIGLGVIGFAHHDDGSLGAGEAKAYATMALVSGATMLVVNGLSAYAGFRDTAACRASREALAGR
jgi:hypothetical protein